MLSSEFDKLNYELGSVYLAPLGFKYEIGNWHFIGDDWQLSFILGKDKDASHFHVKYLTVAIKHLSVQLGDKKIKTPLYSDIDRASPIQISPLKIKLFVESGYSSDVWRYENIIKGNKRSENVYCPIYFGGNRIKSQDQLNVFEAKLISETETKALLEIALSNVAEYGLSWAKRMSPQEIFRQIKENGEDWWIERQWLASYSEAFHNLTEAYCETKRDSDCAASESITLTCIEEVKKEFISICRKIDVSPNDVTSFIFEGDKVHRNDQLKVFSYRNGAFVADYWERGKKQEVKKYENAEDLLEEIVCSTAFVAAVKQIEGRGYDVDVTRLNSLVYVLQRDLVAKIDPLLGKKLLKTHKAMLS